MVCSFKKRLINVVTNLSTSERTIKVKCVSRMSLDHNSDSALRIGSRKIAFLVMK